VIIPGWIAWLLHRLPKWAKVKAFDVGVDQMTEPPPVVPPKPLGTSPIEVPGRTEHKDFTDRR
jgi:hypothetical protein